MEKVIRNLYEEEKRSILEIADILGTSKSTVYRWVQKCNMQGKRRHAYRTPEGQRRLKGSYYEVYHPNHPNANCEGYLYEHDYIMSQMIGRAIREDEVVHHIDGDKLNNDPSNLMLMTRSEHAKLHWVIRKMEQVA